MYKIQAIPTLYKGRQYRSRLEAKWASFFDTVGWAYEYEPFDLGEWSPDFLLKTNGGKCDVLVEVKPITQRDQNVCNKMERAARTAGWDKDLLLLGSSLALNQKCLIGSAALGWLGERMKVENYYVWAPGLATLFYQSSNGYLEQIDFCHDLISYDGRLTSSGLERSGHPRSLEREQAEHIWNQAANAVQWHKSKRS